MAIKTPKQVAVGALEKELASIKAKITLRTKIGQEALDVEGNLFPLIDKISTLEVELKYATNKNTKAYAENKKKLSTHSRRLKQYQDSFTAEWAHETGNLLLLQAQFESAIRMLSGAML